MDWRRLFRDWKDVQEYEAGDRVFSEHDSADAMFLLLSGEVQLELGGEPISIARQGNIFGTGAILGTVRHGKIAKAITDIKLVRIKPEQLKELMHKDTDFAVYIVAELANQLRAVNSYIAEHVVARD